MVKKIALGFPEDDGDDDFRQRLARLRSESDSPQGSDSKNSAHDGPPLFRPTLRCPVPIITVLDDGSLDHGEDVRMRRETLTLGRTSGDLRIPNDLTMSEVHAEIRRTPLRGGYQWLLHDLKSVNGTFMRCVYTVLDETTTVLLGSHRFRLQAPRETGGSDSIQPHTILVKTFSPEALEFPLRSDTLLMGRAYGGADIELDDPLLEDRHATLKRTQDGAWTITAEASRNGIWVSVSEVALSHNSYFRCGEQLFRFVIP